MTFYLGWSTHHVPKQALADVYAAHPNPLVVVRETEHRRRVPGEDGHFAKRLPWEFHELIEMGFAELVTLQSEWWLRLTPSGLKFAGEFVPEWKETGVVS